MIWPKTLKSLTGKMIVISPQIKLSKYHSRTSLVVSGQQSTCQCRGHKFDPWTWKIPYVARQLSLCSTLNPHALEPVFCNKRSHCNEKPVYHTSRAAPTSHNLRKPESSNEDPVQPKKKNQKPTPYYYYY